MVLRIFERSVHRKPVLALYKSLLKLSSSKTLDPELSGRLQGQIRHKFRKNRKLFSARHVKALLVDAFNTHSHLERALSGSADALEALYSLTRLRTPPAPLPPAEPIPPPRPPPPGPHTPNLYRAPTLHFSQYGIPIFVPPVRVPSIKSQKDATQKIKQFRRYAETLSTWLNYYYHVTREEEFLQRLSSSYPFLHAFNVEAGRREVWGMVGLIKQAMTNLAWVEEIRVEKAIKDWVRMHPGAQFRPYGKSMTKARKRELQVWAAEVRRVRREAQLARERARFMRKWELQWGEQPPTPFKHPRQRRLKILARRKRKARMGHPEKVFKNA